VMTSDAKEDRQRSRHALRRKHADCESERSHAAENHERSARVRLCRRRMQRYRRQAGNACCRRQPQREDRRDIGALSNGRVCAPLIVNGRLCAVG
jgi:hypothetical protein